MKNWPDLRDSLTITNGSQWTRTYSSDCNGIRTHNHLVRKRTLRHLASLAKWLSVRLKTKWLCGCGLESCCSWCLFQAKISLAFSQTIECRFTVNLVRDMIITYSQELVQYNWFNVNNERNRAVGNGQIWYCFAVNFICRNELI